MHTFVRPARAIFAAFEGYPQMKMRCKPRFEHRHGLERRNEVTKRECDKITVILYQAPESWSLSCGIYVQVRIKIASSLITTSTSGSEIVVDDMAGCMRRRAWFSTFIKVSISHNLDVSTGMQQRWALGMVEIAHRRPELDRSGVSATRYR